MGNKNAIEKAIKEKMGADTIVKHQLAIPLTVVSSIDGKAGKRECLPMYFNNCPCCAPFGGHEKTAEIAAAIKGGAPDPEAIER